MVITFKIMGAFTEFTFISYKTQHIIQFIII